jgi:hypothetical protein
LSIAASREKMTQNNSTIASAPNANHVYKTDTALLLEFWQRSHTLGKGLSSTRFFEQR